MGTIINWNGYALPVPDGVQHAAVNGPIAFNTPDVYLIEKFGYNTDIDTTSDPEDVWSAGGLHPGKQTAAIPTLVSSDATDDEGNTGAEKVMIYGVDANGDRVSDEVTLNGVSSVNATTSMQSVDRAIVTQAGSNKVNAGTITIAIGGTTVAEIATHIGQTLMAWYHVPVGWTAYCGHWWANCGRSSGYVEIDLMHENANGVHRHRERQLVSAGGSGLDRTFPTAKVFEGGSIIWIRVDETSANDMEVAGGFDLAVLKNK